MATQYSEKFLLTAVNILLECINELAVSDDTELADIIEAQKASTVLEEVKKAVLAEDWDFNRDANWEFAPDSSGYIAVPYNVLDLYSDDSDIIMRDWRLYSKKNKTAIFDKAVKCNVTWDMDFNSLTHPLRHYITIRASKVFQDRMIGNTDQHRYSQEDEQNAYMSAKRSDGRTADYNMLTSDYGLTMNVRG